MYMVFITTLTQHSELPEGEQMAAGQVIAGKLSTKHQAFLEQLFNLLDNKSVDPYIPSTCLHQQTYDQMTEEQQDAIDMELQTICSQLRLIQNMREQSNGTENIHLTSLVEQLWDMVNRIEVENDIFKF
jgi:hypothetical protein